MQNLQIRKEAGNSVLLGKTGSLGKWGGGALWERQKLLPIPPGLPAAGKALLSRMMAAARQLERHRKLSDLSQQKDAHWKMAFQPDTYEGRRVCLFATGPPHLSFTMSLQNGSPSLHGSTSFTSQFPVSHPLKQNETRAVPGKRRM